MRRALCCLLTLLTLAAAPSSLRGAVLTQAPDESAAAFYQTVEDYPRDKRR